MLDYNNRAVIQHLRNNAYYHTSACLSNSVDAFCDDLPDPGCTCDGAARIEALVADVERRAAERDARALREGDAVCAMRDAADAADAALETAIFNDPREQDRLDYEADLRYAYSKPEYHDEDFEDCGGLHDFNDCD